MRINNVTVLGAGILGTQIAFQIAYSGVPVSIYDIKKEVTTNAKATFAKLAEIYTVEVPGAANGKAEAALGRITYFFDLSAAVEDADLVIESVPENLQIKRDAFTRLAMVAPERTIFATNSSTLRLSDLMHSTGRPGRFLGLHFANKIWLANTAEVMGTEQTDPEIFSAVLDFASRIGMVSVPLYKEKPGYILNSLLLPLLVAGMDLAEGGYADISNVDKVWQIATGAAAGPFQILDIIGLPTAYRILLDGDQQSRRLAQWLKENYIDNGKLGIEIGEGFYKYSNVR
ncbi:3-hydroxyacyl-CoA dehydrogenase [Ochrobactrum sp. Q0168]|uniref:3-hydroxyacyl-CoA dehydrogenase n=1 Tax=Ochrobactrum sp. Q0168 TaxID=2793241 RepID=UPI0018EBE42F|nr:3-hydroxyacyl-CoA dehydrogenase [Ochrobactrum sp. Q0168]